MKLRAEYVKIKSEGFLKFLGTAPLTWVSLKLAFVGSQAQERPERAHLETPGDLGVWTTTKESWLSWAHPLPLPRLLLHGDTG